MEVANSPASSTSSTCSTVSDSYSEATKNIIAHYKKAEKNARRKYQVIQGDAVVRKAETSAKNAAERTKYEYETALLDVNALVSKILEEQSDRIKRNAKANKLPFSTQIDQLKALTAQMETASKIVATGPSIGALKDLKERLDRLNASYEGGSFYESENFGEIDIIVSRTLIPQHETAFGKFRKETKDLLSNFATVVFTKLWDVIATSTDDCESHATYSVASSSPSLESPESLESIASSPNSVASRTRKRKNSAKNSPYGSTRSAKRVRSEAAKKIARFLRKTKSARTTYGGNKKNKKN